MTTLTSRPFWQPEIETMDREALRRLQFQRLTEMVNRCAVSGFYRRLWQLEGFDPAGLRTLADIERIPFTHKQDLEQSQVADPPLGDLWLGQETGQEVYPVSTAGGGLLYTAYSPADVERNRELGARLLWCAGVRPGDLVHNSFAYGLFGGGIAAHRAATAIGAGIVPVGTDLLQRQVELLFNLQPTALIAFPSRALYLADRIRERGLDPRDVGLRVGLFGGEPGVVSGRERLEQALGLRALDLYGITEIAPLLAVECSHQQGLHWAEDHVVLEIIDPVTLRPAGPGEVGVLVLTDLTREQMGLVRYWTGDLALVAEEVCPCGRTHARTPGGIRGRADEMVIFRGAKFYPVTVQQVLYTYPDLGPEYRIVLDRDPDGPGDTCTVLVEEAPGAPHNLQYLEERLLRQLQDDVHPEIGVRVVLYGSLDRVLRTARRVEDRRR